MTSRKFRRAVAAEAQYVQNTEVRWENEIKQAPSREVMHNEQMNVTLR